MNITLLATVCHLLTASPEANPGETTRVCTEEHVLSTYENPSLTPMACSMFAQAIIAQWKGNSKFAGDEYNVQGYRCPPGDVEPRGRT